MKFLEPVKSLINKTDLKTFYTYMIIYGIMCLILSILIIIYYYSSVNALQKKIKNIDAHRDDVHEILEKYALIKQQQLIVEEVLAKDPLFKISGTFAKLLADLNLTDKKTSEDLSIIDLEGNYRKTELNAKFTEMTMRELTVLLERLEQNPRIATNRLDITKKKPNDKTIDVSLTISTLLPKIESPSS